MLLRISDIATIICFIIINCYSLKKLVVVLKRFSRCFGDLLLLLLLIGDNYGIDMNVQINRQRCNEELKLFNGY